MGLDIRVMGVGGRGNNSIYSLVKLGIEGVEFIAVDSHPGDLKNCPADSSLFIGENTSGSFNPKNPRLGRKFARENSDEISQAISGADLLFIMAGMGWTTGTGAAPVIAEIAREEGIFTIAAVTIPISCEGENCLKNAREGINKLRDKVDALFVASNDRMAETMAEGTTCYRVFKSVEEVIAQGVNSILELADEKIELEELNSILSRCEEARIGTAKVSGEGAAQKAAGRALESPLFEPDRIDSLKEVIVHISSENYISKQEMAETLEVIKDRLPADATITYSQTLSPENKKTVRVTTIGTFSKGRN